MAQVCNVALIGQKFMGRAHSNAYLKAGKFFNLPLQPVMHTIVGRDLIALAPFADRWGWKNYSTSWKEVIKEPEIHLVDLSVPNNEHVDLALAAISAGKHVACEKPLAGTLKDARQMKNAAVRSRKAKTFVWYNYRRCPAVALAHQMIQAGRLGDIYHVRAEYMQSWAKPDVPMSWRFQKKYSGSGAHNDLNSHIVDMTRFVTGQEFVEVTGAVSETFVAQRAAAASASKPVRSSRRSASMAKVDVDDAISFVGKLNGGAMAVIQGSRVANGYDNHNMIEVIGSKGAVRFKFEDMNVLEYFDAEADDAADGWRRVMCTNSGKHPYAGAWWPDAHIIGYEHTFVNMVADMIAVLGGDEPIAPLPDFADAYETQRVLEAALLAAKNRAAVKLTEIK